MWPGAWSRGRLDCTAQYLPKRWDRPEAISPRSPGQAQAQAHQPVHTCSLCILYAGCWSWCCGPWVPPLGLGPPGQPANHRVPLRKGKKLSPLASIGRSESPAAWKREKGPESAQVASGMLTPGRRAFWSLGSHSRLPAPLALSPRREATKQVATGANSGSTSTQGL